MKGQTLSRLTISGLALMLSAVLVFIQGALFTPWNEVAAQQQAQNQNVVLVAQMGGPTYAVALQGSYAYVGIGPRLVVLNLSDPANPVIVGQTDILPGSVRSVAVAGNYAYVTTGPGGLQIIDISDPTHPAERSSYSMQQKVAAGVAVSGDYAYVADMTPTGGGLHIINISNPAQPVEAGFYSTVGGVWDVAVAGNYAYITNGSWLRIIDVTDPAHPTQKGSATASGTARGIAVSGNFAYVAWEGFLRIFSVADPAFPIGVGGVATQSAYDVAISGNYAYVADGSAGLRIINVSIPNSPIQVGLSDTPGSAYSLAVAGSYAYVADSWRGLRIINISDPANPAESSSVERASGSARSVTTDGNYAYVAAQQGGLRIVDISDPANPAEIGFYDTPGSAYDVAVVGEYAYVADNDSFRILDVSDRTNPNEIGYYSMPSYYWNWSVAISGNYAYITDYGGGLRIIDVTEPSNPTQVGSYSMSSGWSVDIAVSGNYAYLAAQSAGLRIIDISNPANPTEVGFYDTPGTAWGVAVSGNYAYVADGGWGLRIINISNPANPTQVGFYDTPGAAYGVAVAGNRAYVADGSGGLRVIDISDPANPTGLGFYDTPGTAYGVAVSGDHIYVADSDGGLMVLRFFSLWPPTVIPERVGEWGRRVTAVAVQGPYAYIGAGTRLRVVNVSDPAAPIAVGQTNPLSTSPTDWIQDAEVSGNIVYAAASTKGFYTFDVSNPTRPATLGVYDTPGTACSVALSGGYAYVADGTGGLRVISVSNPNAPQEVASLSVSGEAYDVVISGTYAYLAATYGSVCLYVVDISTPNNPSIVGTYSASWCSNVAVLGSYVYVSRRGFGLDVIDVSNPANPQWVYNLSGGAGPLSIAGSYGYMASGDLKVLDLSNPAQPSVAGSVALAGPAQRVAVSGNFAYVAAGQGGLNIVNISNPNSPSLVREYGTSVPAQALDVEGEYAYFSLGHKGIQVIRAKDPSFPVEVNFIDTPGTASALDAQGNYLYVADGSSLRILEVSDPAQPTERGVYTASINGVVVSGTLAYVSGGDFRVLDVSDPSAPSLMGSCPVSGSVRALSGNYAYVQNGLTGLRIVDVTDPQNPSLIGSYNSGTVADVAVARPYAYVADMMKGLCIVNVSDPANPAEVICYKSGTDLWQSVEVKGKLAYVGTYYNKMVYVLDISDPENPTVVGTGSASGQVKDIRVMGDYAYTADYAGPADLEGGLTVLRLSVQEEVSVLGGAFSSIAGNKTFQFPAGAFTQTVRITYRPLEEWVFGTWSSVGPLFEVTAVYSDTGEPAQLAPGQTYAVTIRYTDSDLGAIPESTLGLYWWDGSQWHLEPSSQTDAANNVITARPNHFSKWGILGLLQTTLSMSKSVEPTTDVPLGSVVTYTVVVSNVGPAEATVTLTDPLPLEVTFGGWVQGAGVYADGMITWTGALSSGAQASLVFTATVGADEALFGKTITNTAFYTSDNGGSGEAIAVFAIQSRQPGVAFAPDREGAVEPGGSVAYTHILTNTGNGPDTFSLALGGLPAGWSGSVAPTSISLAAGASAPVTVTVQAPTGALSGTVATAVVTATSSADPAVQATVADQTTVLQRAGVALAPDREGTVLPGETVTYTHILTNTGNGLDTFTLALGGLPAGWSGSVAPTSISLAAGASAPVTVTVQAPTGALSGTVATAVVTATSSADPSVWARVTDRTTVQVARYYIYLPLVLRNYGP